MRLMTLAAVCFAASSVWGQTCSNMTIRGTYALTCTGFVSPAPNASQMPFSAIGMVKTDAGGTATGSAQASLGGAILEQVVSGTAVVNPDCTGTVVYDQKINGQPGPKLNIAFHVLDNGQEIRGMSLDAGNTMSCSLRLVSRQ